MSKRDKKKKKELKKKLRKKRSEEAPETYKKAPKVDREEAEVAQAAMLKEKKGKDSHFQQFYGKDEKEKKKLLERVEGKGLDKILEEGKRKKWLREHKEELIEQTAEIAKELTKKGTIHGDIKPKNIVVKDKEGKPFLKLIDFEFAETTAADRKGKEWKDYYTREEKIKKQLDDLVSLTTHAVSDTPFKKKHPKSKTSEKEGQISPELKTNPAHFEELKGRIREEVYDAYERKIDKMHGKRKSGLIKRTLSWFKKKI